MARRHVVVRGSVRSRRATQWVASSLETAVTNLAGSSVLLDQTLTGTEPFTVVRTRGTLWVGSDQVATNEIAIGSLGMAVVSDQAAAIGVTAIPTPATDQESDLFFLWTPFLSDTRVVSAVGFETNTFSRNDFDSKAMRKVNENETIVVVLENSSSVGLDFLLNFRMLLKLV